MGIRRRPRIKIILILLLLILFGAGAGIFFYIRHLTGSTNYMNDEDVTAVQPVSESEAEPPVTADSLYDLSGVSPVPASLLENTYTLLVIGGGDSPDVPEDDTEHASDSAFSVSEEASENALAAGGESTGYPADEPEESSETADTGRQKKNAAGRSDAEAVILMTINHNVSEMFLTSFHTNLYVEIPGYAPGSLGSAYALGGGPLLQKTMELNYGIPSDNYASISLKEVARIIGMPEFETINISRDGLDVVEELVHSLNARSPAKVAGYINELLPYVTHNIDDARMLRLIFQIPKLISYYSTKAMVPYEGLWQEADGYLVADAAETSRRLQAMSFPDVPEAGTE